MRRCSKRLVRMVPGSARNWIAVSAVHQTGCDVTASRQLAFSRTDGATDRSSDAPPSSDQSSKWRRRLLGVGEKFSANRVTGTGSMAWPIATSPGRFGFAATAFSFLRFRRWQPAGRFSLNYRIGLSRVFLGGWKDTVADNNMSSIVDLDRSERNLDGLGTTRGASG